MKFFTLFAGVAAASAVVKRDIGTVTDAIQSISDATQNLQQGIQGFNGAGQVESLTSASQATIDAINQANSQVAGTDDLTTEDALQLPGPINQLSSLVSDTVDALIAKKPVFDQNGVSSVVEQQAIQLRDASNTFTQTLLGKVPDALQTIGRNLAAPIQQALDRAVQAFADSGSAGPTGTATSTGSSGPTGTPSAYPTGSASSTGSAAPYPTGGSSSAAPAPTGGASIPAGESPTEVSPPIYTGAAAQAGAGFGVAAVAALAAVAAF